MATRRAAVIRLAMVAAYACACATGARCREDEVVYTKALQGSRKIVVAVREAPFAETEAWRKMRASFPPGVSVDTPKANQVTTYRLLGPASSDKVLLERRTPLYAGFGMLRPLDVALQPDGALVVVERDRTVVSGFVAWPWRKNEEDRVQLVPLDYTHSETWPGDWTAEITGSLKRGNLGVVLHRSAPPEILAKSGGPVWTFRWKGTRWVRLTPKEGQPFDGPPYDGKPWPPPRKTAPANPAAKSAPARN